MKRFFKAASQVLKILPINKYYIEAVYGSSEAEFNAQL